MIYFWVPPKHVSQAQNETNDQFSENLKIIGLKGISEEGFLFKGNVKIFNVSLKFLTRMLIQKLKFSLYKKSN